MCIDGVESGHRIAAIAVFTGRENFVVQSNRY